MSQTTSRCLQSGGQLQLSLGWQSSAMGGASPIPDAAFGCPFGMQLRFRSLLIQTHRLCSQGMGTDTPPLPQFPPCKGNSGTDLSLIGNHPTFQQILPCTCSPLQINYGGLQTPIPSPSALQHHPKYHGKGQSPCSCPIPVFPLLCFSGLPLHPQQQMRCCTLIPLQRAKWSLGVLWLPPSQHPALLMPLCCL